MTARRHSMGRWLWSGYLRRHLRIISIALVVMVIEGSTLGVMSYMTKPMFDNVFIGGDMTALWVVGLIIMGVFFLRAITSVVHRVLLKRVSELSAAQLRTDLMAHLMTLDMAFHQAHSPGTLIERVQGYAFEGYDGMIDSHIKNLRKRMDAFFPGEKIIHTVYGIGYKFEFPNEFEKISLIRFSIPGLLLKPQIH